MDHAAGGKMLWNPYELDNIFPAESLWQVLIEEASEGGQLLTH